MNLMCLFKGCALWCKGYVIMRKNNYRTNIIIRINYFCLLYKIIIQFNVFLEIFSLSIY